MKKMCGVILLLVIICSGQVRAASLPTPTSATVRIAAPLLIPPPPSPPSIFQMISQPPIFAYLGVNSKWMAFNAFPIPAALGPYNITSSFNGGPSVPASFGTCTPYFSWATCTFGIGFGPVTSILPTYTTPIIISVQHVPTGQVFYYTAYTNGL